MEQFENFFDWADQIKDSEIARWEIMYGCTPDRLLKEIKTALTQLEKTVREEVEEKWRKSITEEGESCDRKIQEAREEER